MFYRYDSCENPFVPNSPICINTNTRVLYDEPTPSDGELLASDDDEPLMNEKSTVTVMEI